MIEKNLKPKLKITKKKGWPKMHPCQIHKFSKTIYEEKCGLNMETFDKLEQATSIENETLLNEGMESVSQSRCQS